jgi:hypothetical protein
MFFGKNTFLTGFQPLLAQNGGRTTASFSLQKDFLGPILCFFAEFSAGWQQSSSLQMFSYRSAEILGRWRKNLGAHTNSTMRQKQCNFLSCKKIL